MNLLPVLEGILFIVGEDGITLEKIKEILEINDEEIANLLNKLQEKYLKEDSGLRLDVLGNSLKLTTKKEHQDYYKKLVEVEDDTLLSQAALETLAIIAYNEPVTRVQIDEIRGISSSHIVRKLHSKNLIKELGKSDAPGRPILYGVTKDFLDYFGLRNLEELPKLQEVEITEDEEKDLFESKYKDN